MTERLVLDPFALVSLVLGAAAALGVVLVAIRVRVTSGALRDQLSGVVGGVEEIVSGSDAAKVRAVLEEFEVQLTARVQKTERAFVILGEEVTEALDRAQQLDRSASAKRSRAKALLRKQEQQEETETNGPGGDYWADPNLSREQKLDLARADLNQRGHSI